MTRYQLFPEYCAAGWVARNTSCFKLSESEKAWEDGETHCQLEGGHLTSVHSAEENMFLHGFSFTPDSFWLGGKNEGIWKWTDGTSFSFTDWGPGEPDGGKGDCLEKQNSRNGWWNDRLCTDQLKFMCKVTIGEGLSI